MGGKMNRKQTINTKTTLKLKTVDASKLWNVGEWLAAVGFGRSTTLAFWGFALGVTGFKASEPVGSSPLAGGFH
jgi:hypothetical protein